MNLKKGENFKVLIGVLDWGLGHASRMVPVIRYFQSIGYEVNIASSGKAARFLIDYFPHLNHFTLPSYGVEYKTHSLTLNALANFKSVLRSIQSEHKSLKALLSDLHPDLIVSDNRYGFFSETTPSIFIGHQLQLEVPLRLKWLSPAIQYLYHRMLKGFNQIWVPDYEGKMAISGKMGSPNGLKIPVYYLGLLSRFEEVKPSEKNDENSPMDVLIWLSGPEPMRTEFENIILKKVSESRLNFVLIRGLSGNRLQTIPKNLEVYDHLNDQAFLGLIQQASMIVCRSGYSSVMDLLCLQKSALLVPTPGQPEQEYLAKSLSNSKLFTSFTQGEFERNFDFDSTYVKNTTTDKYDIKYKAEIEKALQSIFP